MLAYAQGHVPAPSDHLGSTAILASTRYLAITEAFASSLRWKITLFRSAMRSKCRLKASANLRGG